MVHGPGRKGIMTTEKELLWLLRLYGPCPFAKLVHRSRKGRDSLWSAMGRLREKLWAEKCGRVSYRITPEGKRHIGTEESEARQRTFL